jgi:signal-transduction protein with cAMP-binding, CBS, and nucleotidyltransferase domain
MLNIDVRVRAFMNSNIVGVERGKSIKLAAKRMAESGISSIIITDERSRPVGIITERDIVQRVVAMGKNTDRAVEEVMSSPLITVDSLATLGEAGNLMIQKKIKRLLIKENERIIGIVTQSDIQRGILETFNSLLLT